MENLFNITIHLCRNGESLLYKGSVEFFKQDNDYGNGYGMYIKCQTEPFGSQSYDIRYDKDFDENNMLLYIVDFFAHRFSGKNGGWKLTGIRVYEAEEI